MTALYIIIAVLVIAVVFFMIYDDFR